jgi:HAD superfamily hydrolase (TIGR01509 family)
MTPELVIFDLDGVLIDSERIAVRIESKFLTQLGWPLTEAEVAERFMGRSPQVMVDAVEQRFGDRLPADWVERWTASYRAAYEAELQPVDGAIEMLDALSLPSCIATSSEPESLRFKLGVTGLWERFEGRIFSASEVEHGKPAPDLFLHAAAQMGVAPGRCVVVEDSQYGVQAARAAGMEVFAYVGGGLNSVASLVGPGTTIFDDMRVLPRLLGE